MDRKESKNGLELIKYGAIRLKGNFSALFMGALAMVTPLTLIFLIPYLISRLTDTYWVMSIGIALFAVLVGPLQIGYIIAIFVSIGNFDYRTSLAIITIRNNQCNRAII